MNPRDLADNAHARELVHPHEGAMVAGIAAMEIGRGALRTGPGVLSVNVRSA